MRTLDTDGCFANFRDIVSDNERSAHSALDRGDYLHAFLIIHTLIESLLRQFLHKTGDKSTFASLIDVYEKYLKQEHYPHPEFVDELTQFNRRRNRIVHQLWQKGYTFTNKNTQPAADAAVALYGLLIEWLETFDPEIAEHGFQYE